jgi:hypothetical protein
VSASSTRVRPETGSIWPSIALHTTWNSVIQSAFGAASTGVRAAFWVGEAVILTALALVVATFMFSRGALGAAQGTRWAATRRRCDDKPRAPDADETEPSRKGS